MPSRFEVLGVEGLPEVRPGDDVAGLVAAAVALQDGDVVVVTSKVVSKAEGRVRTGDREDAIAEETVRVVARRGPTVIVRNRLGLTMAAAGVDASNVEAGSIVLAKSKRRTRQARASRSRFAVRWFRNCPSQSSAHSATDRSSRAGRARPPV